MIQDPQAGFGKCSMCRRKIELGQKYFRCSVTACNTGRVKLLFCTVACWDAHLPTARHRNAAAVEDVAKRE
ncbi:MAG: hypothetical protein IT370_01725 [Deltaproteobacteria bacterium]|jgi:hypothetical protein|nr:hypothetical protein [Deltaproteobacteria bacterium]